GVRVRSANRSAPCPRPREPACVWLFRRLVTRSPSCRQSFPGLLRVAPATPVAGVSGPAGDVQLVLGVPDPLLELPAVGGGLAALHALELGLGCLELLLRAPCVDLARLDRVVDEREGSVLLDLEEPGAGRELDDVLRVAVAVDPGRRSEGG